MIETDKRAMQALNQISRKGKNWMTVIGMIIVIMVMLMVYNITFESLQCRDGRHEATIGFFMVGLCLIVQGMRKQSSSGNSKE